MKSYMKNFGLLYYMLIKNEDRILGANGFLGIHLCELLLKKRYDIIAFYHTIDRKYTLDKFKIPKIQIDICNQKELENIFRTNRALKNLDVLIHCASYVSIGNEPKKIVETINRIGTQNIVDLCFKFKIKKLIYISSIHAIDHNENTPIVDERLPSATRHKLTYNRTKSQAQEIVQEAVGKGLFAVTVNPTGFLGPQDHLPTFMGKFIVNVYRKKIPSLVNAGFNWVDVRDVALGTYLALTKGKKGERYILGGHWKTVKEISKMIEKITSKKTIQFCVPVYLAFLGLPFLQLYSKLFSTPPLYTYDSLLMLKEASPNISYRKASKMLGYKSRPFETTMRDTCVWFKENGYFKD